MYLINDSTHMDVAVPVIDGQRAATGCVPRDFTVQPTRAEMKAVNLEPFSKQEIIDRAKERKARGAGLRLLRRAKKLPAMNQYQWGYCWAHSPTMMLMLELLKANNPKELLSAFMVAATIKKGRNEGGWAALALDFLMKYGTCTQAKWPQNDANPNRFNDPAVREDAIRHLVTESWADMSEQAYDRNLTYMQVLSLLVTDTPVAADYHWWGHSVCLLDVDVIDNEPVPVGVNSWGEAWGDQGEFTLQGNRAIPNGAVSLRVSLAV